MKDSSPREIRIKVAGLKKYLYLGKFSIVLPVSFTSFTGYFLYRSVIDINLVMSVAGVFLLGVAASALNQIQERDIDALMQRTYHRPLPSGSVSRMEASVFFFAGIIPGSALLYIFGSGLAMALGLFTIIWYNGLYTYLKRITAFAAVPGALTGAMPPLIGWTAAGGLFWEHTAILLAFLLFMAQVPHFWLLILKYGNQYRQAGLPALTGVFSRRQIARITYAWIVASLLTALLLGYFDILQSQITRIILLICTIAAFIFFFGLIRKKMDHHLSQRYFIVLNAYFMLVMVLLLIDKLIS